MVERTAPAARGVSVARRIVVALWVALVLASIHAIWRDAARPAGVLALTLLLLVPLALPARGIVLGDRRTLAWATLCLAPHIGFGFTELVANPAMRWVACGILVLAFAAGAALVALLRLTRGRQ